MSISSKRTHIYPFTLLLVRFTGILISCFITSVLWQVYTIRHDSHRNTVQLRRYVECHVAASSYNFQVLQRNISRFWGSNDHIVTFLRALGQQPFTVTWSNFIDIGAGAYSSGGGDAALIFSIDECFPSKRKDIVAFEPGEEAYENLLRAKDEYLRERQVQSTQFTIFRMGCSSQANGTLEFRGKRNSMTANRRISNHSKYRGETVLELQATTCDAVAESRSWESVNVLKTDTEGLEFEVLLGAKALLSKRAIDLLIVAYEDKWTWDSFTAAYPDGNRSTQTQLEFDTPNLQSVSTWLHDELGYHSYLLGNNAYGGPVAIPLYGKYWLDDFEIARQPLMFGLPFTWFDFIAVPASSPIVIWLETICTDVQFCS